ncbi:MAG TPA: helix-turn-helix transcriptional regulator [Candidatus Omnitrophota bacterium]|nr:helix-turn-helix transcriptional regulator [Candidatus Omnitrophota bacterium]
MNKDWLWDRNISAKQAGKILGNPGHPEFITLAALLLSRKNVPREVFRDYLKPQDFCRNWKEIKQRMRKDAWGSPRIGFWQAVYEKLLEKYRGKAAGILLRSKAKPYSGFCLLVGGKLRLLRKEKNLTQNALADKLEVSQQLISRIESGRENISLLTLKKITDKLGAKIDIIKTG